MPAFLNALIVLESTVRRPQKILEYFLRNPRGRTVVNINVKHGDMVRQPFDRLRVTSLMACKFDFLPFTANNIRK